MRKFLSLSAKASVSICAIAGTLFFLAEIPPRQEDAQEGQEPSLLAASLPDPYQPGALRMGGLPFTMETKRIASCSAATWDPAGAGYCTGECAWLAAERTRNTATFTWIEGGSESPGELHGVYLDCAPDQAGGQVSHFVTSVDQVLESVSGPRTPPSVRESTLPLLPGAEEVMSYSSAGFRIFLDRPRLAETALEELHVELASRGWRLAGGTSFEPGHEPAPTKIYLRGGEMCVSALRLDEDGALLVSAYSHVSRTSEESR